MVGVVLVIVTVWSVAVVATTVHVGRVRSGLANVAQEIAHHNAHLGGDADGGRAYLSQRLEHLGRPLKVQEASIRTVTRGNARVVEVRLSTVIGFAIGGHPRVRVSVTRSAPVEALAGLP